MNHAHSYLAKTEIAKQLGYFPEFLNSATNSSLIFRSLVQQTLSAYINNPLPDLFKEKLFVGLSRYCGASYFTICHSCTLLSLGVSATEILALEKVSIPQGEADIAFDLDLLRSQWQDTKDWHNPSIETSLLHCSYFIFLHPFQANSCINTLKELLGTFYYHYLAVFLEYIKLCHYWLGNNPEISHQKDLRSQLHLHSLLSSDNRLADFLQSNTKLEISNLNKIAIESCSLQKEHLPKFKIEQKSLIKYLTNLSFPVMIRSQDEKVLYLNHNWVETTGYNKADIPTVATWKQKAEVKSCNTKQLATEIYPATEHHFSWQSSETDTQAGNILREIATFLSQFG